jgi:hypothetical protein
VSQEAAGGSALPPCGKGLQQQLGDEASQTCLLAPCTQVVFWDLRQELLEGLYRHRVEEARLQPILDILDATLGGLVEASVPVSRRTKECCGGF